MKFVAGWWGNPGIEGLKHGIETVESVSHFNGFLVGKWWILMIRGFVMFNFTIL